MGRCPGGVGGGLLSRSEGGGPLLGRRGLPRGVCGSCLLRMKSHHMVAKSVKGHFVFWARKKMRRQCCKAVRTRPRQRGERWAPHCWWMVRWSWAPAATTSGSGVALSGSRGLLQRAAGVPDADAPFLDVHLRTKPRHVSGSCAVSRATGTVATCC